MKLIIDRVIDYGTLASERVELSAVEDCDLSNYIIVDTTYVGENYVSNKLRHTHWFSAKEVKIGDKIVLYTKSGISKTEDINNGRNKRYTLYWDLGSSVWNNTGDAAVLLQISAWKTTKVVEN